MIERKEMVQDLDTTLVRPLFDDAAAESARPVVPLAAGGGYPAGQRRSWLWALVITSAIVGSVLGVLGVGFYQRRRAADVPTATRVEPTPEPPAFPSPSPTPEVVAVVETSEPSPAPATEESSLVEDAEEIPETTPTQPPARRDARPGAKKADEMNRPSSDDDEDDARPARERVDENGDDEPEGGATRPRRARQVEPQDAPDDQTNGEDDPGPRRVDRVRDIFTGDQTRREQRRRERLRRRGERLPEDFP